MIGKLRHNSKYDTNKISSKWALFLKKAKGAYFLCWDRLTFFLINFKDNQMNFKLA